MMWWGWIVALAILLFGVVVSKWTTNPTVSLLVVSAHPVSIYNFTLLTTNDLHSAFHGDPGVGNGYPALCTMLEVHREIAGETTYTFDAGDWYSGSLLDKLGPSPHTPWTPELQFFQQCGYDAITIGNHDFDEGEDALRRMLDKLRQLPDPTNFRVVSTNIDTPGPLKDLQEAGTIVEVHALTGEPGGPQVCVLGALGPDGAVVSRSFRQNVTWVGFNEESNTMDLGGLATLLSDRAAAIRQPPMGCSVVVLLYHGGGPEDAALAAKVSGIDIVVSGHTHDTDIRTVSGIHLHQCGERGGSLGVMRFGVDSKGSVFRRSSACEPVRAHPPHPAVITLLKDAHDALGDLPELPLTYHDEVYYQEGPVGPFRPNQTRSEMAVAFASSIITALNDRGIDADMYFYSPEWVRGTFHTDSSSEVDHSESFSLHYYQLYEAMAMVGDTKVVHWWLPKADLIRAIDIVRIARWTLSDLFDMVTSDTLLWDERWWGIPFLNRVRAPTLHGKPFSEWPEFIHCATNTVGAQLLWDVKDISYGIIKELARNSTGGWGWTAADATLNVTELELLVEYLPANYRRA